MTDPAEPTAKPPRRKNCVTVDLTDQQMALAVVLGKTQEEMVTAAVARFTTETIGAMKAVLP